MGINSPVISPDGKQVAFTALGDLYVVPIGGGKPVNITHDRFLDADPAWSADGTQLAWSTDRGGTLQDIWIHDFKTGQESAADAHRDIGAQGVVVAGWKAHRVQRRGWDVAARDAVDGGRGHGQGDADP